MGQLFENLGHSGKTILNVGRTLGNSQLGRIVRYDCRWKDRR